MENSTADAVELAQTTERAIGSMPQVPQAVYANTSNEAERASPIPIQAMPSLSSLRRRRPQGEPSTTSADHEQISLEPPTQSARDDPNPNDILGYGKIKHEIVEKIPHGIPRLASLMNSNESWTIFRGFEKSHIRVLLHLGFEINKLENELEKLDKEDEQDPAKEYRLVGVEYVEGVDPEQRELLHKLKKKLREYNTFLLEFSRIRALGKPSSRDYRSVFNWIEDNFPIREEENDYFYHEDDFIAVTQHSKKDWFQDFLEALGNRYPKSRIINNLLKTEKEHKKTRNKFVNYYSKTRLGILAQLFFISTAVALLLVPVSVLFLVPMARLLMVCTILAFVIVFAATISVVTDAKPSEVFLGLAAYTAVLVTFLGNINQGNDNRAAAATK